MSDFNSLLNWSRQFSQPQGSAHLPAPPIAQPMAPSLSQMWHDYKQRHPATAAPAPNTAPSDPGPVPSVFTSPTDPAATDPGSAAPAGAGAMPPINDPGPQLQVSPDIAAMGQALASSAPPAGSASGHSKGGPGSVTGVLSNLGMLP